MLEHYINLAIKAAFVENLALAFFLGMCPFTACSKKVETAWGLGLAVTFITATSAPLCQLINEYLLKSGALSWVPYFGPELKDVDLSFLGFVSFVAAMAAGNQIVEMFIERYVPALYNSLGVFLPLISVNCAILGVVFFMVEREYTFTESIVFGLGGGFGWLVAIVSLAAIRERLRYSNIPVGLRGVGITYVVCGLMGLCFMAFSGIQL